jgi:hypothetical protein
MEEKGCFLGWYFQYMHIGTRPSLDLMTTPEQHIQRWDRINRTRRESDHPYVLRECVALSGALPTHPEAEGILTELAPDLDRYSEEYGRLADEVWMEHYQQPHQRAEGGATA